jgi:S1-C subfamily serine protease
VRNGSVQRPDLGINPRDVEALRRQVELPVSDGVLIWSVRPGGPAANAGLKGLARTDEGDIELGDIIVAVDGQKIANNDDLYRFLDKHQINDTVSVDVIRRGRHTTIPVRLTVTAPQRRRGYSE